MESLFSQHKVIQPNMTKNYDIFISQKETPSSVISNARQFSTSSILCASLNSDKGSKGPDYYMPEQNP